MFARVVALLTICVVAVPTFAADDTTQALATLKSIGREGKGNDAAAEAWKRLVSGGVSALIPTLAAMKDADAAASNWLRTAIDAIAENEKVANRKLPLDQLEAFVKDTTQSPPARRIGFELLAKEAPQTAETLLASFVDDPSLELRRDAIALGIKQAKTPQQGSQATPVQIYRRLFQAARDKDQVEELARTLDKLGEKPSITEHFGYVTHWQLIGPFDSTEGKGFPVAYPPEAKVDLAAKLKGKANADVAWVPFVTSDRYATLDFNKGLGKHMDCVGYAFALISAEKELPVEIRMSSQNAVQVFLNGKRVFSREEYHHGSRMDQHVARGTLKTGNNELLVKVCQNNQDQSWAQVWAVQCRLCDATGGGLPVTQVVPSASGTQKHKLGFTLNPMEETKEPK